MTCNTIAVLVSLLFLSNLAYTDESRKVGLPYTVKTKKIECIVNPVLLSNCSCELKPVNWKRSVANIEVFLLKPLRNTTLRIELYKYTNQYRPFVINVTGNACKWFDKKEPQSAYYKIFINMITKFTNFNHTCPYTGWLRGKGLYFEPELALFTIPAGTYMFVFTGFEGYPYTYLGTVKYVVVINDEENLRYAPRRDKIY